MVNKLELLQIYKLRIRLLHIEPEIFRAVVTPGNITLQQFHILLQGAFGWFCCHLHAFRDQDGQTYTSAHESGFAMDMGEDDVDDATVQLDSVLRVKGDLLFYEYDFGDGWEHEIVLQEIGLPKAQEHYPAVIDGARNCPPEDCGGPWGYESLMEVAQQAREGQKLDDDEKQRLEWLGDYDFEAFDLDQANRRVASYNKLS